MTTELLKQASAHLRAWHKKYGEHQPDWLPPAKDVELLGEIDAALAQPADEDAWLATARGLLSKAMFAASVQRYVVEAGDALMAHLRARPAREGFVSVPVEPTSMHGLSITSSVEDGTWLRFDLPGGASAAISVLLLAEKFNEKSIVSQVLKEWSAMIATAKKGTEK